MPQLERIRLLIEFALLSAAEADDFFARKLGIIHLLKYLYLADLAYAEKHKGERFTDTKWIFYHFGPWSAETWAEIPKTLERLGAQEERFPSSRYEKDAVRYSMDKNERRLEELEAKMPFWVTRSIKNAIQKYGSDTSGLLHYVYKTPPMIKAAFKDELNFDSVAKETEVKTTPEVAPSKQWKAKHADLQKKVQEMLAQKKSQPSKLVPQVSPPRYDEVFERGLRTLERTEEMKPLDGELVFGDDIWHSPFRTDDELS